MYIMGMSLLFLVCPQDLQKGLVCNLIIGIAQPDLPQVPDRVIELFRSPRPTYEMEIAG